MARRLDKGKSLLAKQLTSLGLCLKLRYWCIHCSFKENVIPLSPYPDTGYIMRETHEPLVIAEEDEEITEKRPYSWLCLKVIPCQREYITQVGHSCVLLNSKKIIQCENLSNYVTFGLRRLRHERSCVISMGLQKIIWLRNIVHVRIKRDTLHIRLSGCLSVADPLPETWFLGTLGNYKQLQFSEKMGFLNIFFHSILFFSLSPFYALQDISCHPECGWSKARHNATKHSSFMQYLQNLHSSGQTWFTLRTLKYIRCNIHLAGIHNLNSPKDQSRKHRPTIGVGRLLDSFQDCKQMRIHELARGPHPQKGTCALAWVLTSIVAPKLFLHF